MSKPMVSVILINYNTYELTLDCVKSFDLSSYKDFELIIIDNASRENKTADFGLLSFSYSVEWIRSNVNLGFAGANNLGIKHAKGEYLFFINNDTEITENLLEILVETLANNSKIGLISPKILFHETNIIQYAGSTALSFLMRNESILFGSEDSATIDASNETHYAHGAAMMTTRKIVEVCGLMPEDYFLYYEELDWCEMIKRKGYLIWVNQRAVIYHKESMSIGKSNPLKTYYLTRNRLLFKRRNYPKLQAFIFFSYYIVLMPFKLLIHLVKGETDHASAYFRAMKWHFLKNRTAQ